MFLSVEFWFTLETYRKGAPSYHASHSGKSELLIVGATDKPTLVISRLFVNQEFVLGEAGFDVAAAITPGAGFFHDPCRQAGG